MMLTSLMIVVGCGRYIVENLWIETCLVIIALVAKTHLHQFAVGAFVIEPIEFLDVSQGCLLKLTNTCHAPMFVYS